MKKSVPSRTPLDAIARAVLTTPKSRALPPAKAPKPAPKPR